MSVLLKILPAVLMLRLKRQHDVKVMILKRMLEIVFVVETMIALMEMNKADKAVTMGEVMTRLVKVTGQVKVMLEMR